jgi:hypothetical protein
MEILRSGKVVLDIERKVRSLRIERSIGEACAFSMLGVSRRQRPLTRSRLFKADTTVKYKIEEIARNLVFTAVDDRFAELRFRQTQEESNAQACLLKKLM